MSNKQPISTFPGIAPELQGAIINLAFEVIWEMPVHRACNRNDTDYDTRAA